MYHSLNLSTTLRYLNGNQALAEPNGQAQENDLPPEQPQHKNRPSTTPLTPYLRFLNLPITFQIRKGTYSQTWFKHGTTPTVRKTVGSCISMSRTGRFLSNSLPPSGLM